MAFNITGGVTITNTVPANPPLQPTSVMFTQVTKNAGTLTWNHEASINSPHSGFRVEFKPSDTDEWEVFATVPTTPQDTTVGSEGFSFSIDVEVIANFGRAYDFRVTAVSSAVGAKGVDSTPSALYTFTPQALNAPTVVTLETRQTPDGASLDTGLLEWTHDSGLRCITHYELEQQETSIGGTPTDTGWQLLTTIAYEGSDYEYIQNGYALEANDVWYRVRAVAIDGETSAYSVLPTIAQFSPGEVSAISLFVFERNGPDTGEFIWVYDDATPIRSFLLENTSGDNPGTFSPVATIDANTDVETRNVNGVDTEVRVFQLGGFSSEENSQLYQMRTVGQNGVGGTPRQLAEPVVPIAPASPVSLTISPREGQGVVTSIDFTWTPPPVTNTTHVTQIILEFRPIVFPEVSFVQIAIFSPDEFEAQLAPPVQGPIEFRLVAQGQNNFMSDNATNPTGTVTISHGATTDDGIHNTDGAFIAQQHFRVEEDDFCPIYIPPTTDPQGVLVPETASIILRSGGVFNVPTDITVTPGDTNPVVATGSIVGNQGEDLVFDWKVSINDLYVSRRRHMFLNMGIFTALSNVINGNNNCVRSVGWPDSDTICAMPPGSQDGGPTRTWDVDNGSVSIEVLADPDITSNYYLNGSANAFIYADSTGIFPPSASYDPADQTTETLDEDHNASNTRSFVARQAGSNSLKYSSRTQLRLNMRRVFTFRATGIVTLRITFRADTQGFPIIPIFHENAVYDPLNLGPTPGLPATWPEQPWLPHVADDQKLCLNAWASEIIESATILSTDFSASGSDFLGTYTFDREYEIPPFVQLTAHDRGAPWIESKSMTEVQIGTETSAKDIDITVRGY